MLSEFLFLCLISVVFVSFVLLCNVYIVPPARAQVLLDGTTQKRRIIREGVHQAWPWETPVQVHLPHGEKALSTSTFITDGSSMRYDPPPYHALTKDQVSVDIDLWIEYATDDVLALTERPNANFQPVIDDLVRARMQECVSFIPRAKLNTITLQNALKNVTWPKWSYLHITHVGIQDIIFDAQTSAMARALSLGLSKLDALEHVERMGLNESMRSNHGTRLIVGESGRTRRSVNE